ncbi:tetratricopeptide repeat protein [Myroides sp. LJL115]
METFASMYEQIQKQMDSSPSTLNDLATQLVKQDDFSLSSNLYQALAICQKATYIQDNSSIYLDLFSKLFQNSNLAKISILLPQDQYVIWYEIMESLGKFFCERGFTKANFLLFLFYQSARVDQQGQSKSFVYLEKAFLDGQNNAMAFYARALYYGYYSLEIDKEKAIELLNQCVQENNKYGIAFLCDIQISACTSTEQVWEVFQTFGLETLENNSSLYYVGEYYLQINDYQKAKDILQGGHLKGISSCSYLLGVLSCNGQLQEFGLTPQDGMVYLETAFSQGEIEAGYFLGMYLLDSSAQDKEQYKRGIYFLKQSSLYNFPKSLIALAIEHMDQEEHSSLVLDWLDQAIALDSSDAKVHKAIYLVKQQSGDQNIALAQDLLLSAIDQGNIQAIYELALLHHNGVLKEQSNAIKALELFEQAASSNHLYAMEYVGQYYLEGFASGVDLEKAKYWFELAIEKFNSVFAKVEMAHLYLDGIGVEKDQEKALELLKQAVDQDYPYAAFRLGVLYQNQSLGYVDYEKARYYLEIAAQYNSSEAVYLLACLNFYEDQDNLNPQLAVQQFEQALEMGLFKASVDIALAYEQGYDSVEPNMDMAFKYMLIGAENGFDFAQYKIGYYLLYGYNEQEPDIEQAIFWLEKAIEQGNGYAMLTLGDYYLYGGQDQDYTKSFNYYHMAEQIDYISEGIGVCYQFGIGCEKDEKLAFKYYEVASETQNLSAIQRLGQAYYFGIGCEVDKQQAFHYLKLASDMGSHEAMDYIGLMLVKGDGCQSDPELGVSYLLQAAEVGYHTAQYELANCYLQGLGVEQSDEVALHWYGQAAENGNEDAQKIVGGPRKRRR